MYSSERKPIGQILLEENLITEEQIQTVLNKQIETGDKFGEICVDLKYITEDDLVGCLSEQLDIPYVNLGDQIIDPEVARLVPFKIANRNYVVPYERDGNTLSIAMADPQNIQVLDDLQLMLSMDIYPFIAKKSDINKAIAEYYESDESVEHLLQDMGSEDVEILRDEGDLTDAQAAFDDTPIIKLVNLILLQAIKDRASDIHIEPFEDFLVVRERIDGVLHKLPEPPKQYQAGIISRLKIMADLNIAESRLPQDGRIKLKLGGKEIDIRVSCLPTVFGESVVLRVLDRGAIQLTLDTLGLLPDLMEQYNEVLNRPNGIIVVTGPTGCGKTTTLYAGINKINKPEDKLITVEDPVEFEVEGLVQCQVNEKVGMTFAAALRSILRQDPDIILIGEMRDVETSQIAIQSSLTGHLVLSTLHTNQAAGAITRLVDMGLEPFLLTSTIEAVIGQRLVRTICPFCKEEWNPTEDMMKSFGVPEDEYKSITYYHGRGCDECASTGFKGRSGIFEFLRLNNEIKNIIMEKEPASVIQQRAIELGMRTMLMDGWEKIKMGTTSIDEVLRVAPAATAL